MKLDWNDDESLSERVKLPVDLFLSDIYLECNTDKPLGELVRSVSLTSGHNDALQTFTGSFIDSHNSINKDYYIKNQVKRKRYLARLPFWFCIRTLTYGTNFVDFVRQSLPTPLSKPIYLDIKFVNTKVKDLVKLVLHGTYVDHNYVKCLHKNDFMTGVPDTFHLSDELVFDTSYRYALKNQETTIPQPNIPPFMGFHLHLTDSEGDPVELDSIEFKLANVSVTNLPALFLEHQMDDCGLYIHPERSIYQMMFNSWYCDTESCPLSIVIKLRNEPSSLVKAELTFMVDADIVCKPGQCIYKN